MLANTLNESSAGCFTDGLMPIPGTKPLLLQCAGSVVRDFSTGTELRLGTLHEMGKETSDNSVRTSFVLYFLDGSHLRMTLRKS